MPRKNRTPSWLSDCCYHVSNTCYNPACIFRFANARQQALLRLRDINSRFPIRFLDYFLHPDGYRLLIETDHPGPISEVLRSFHVGTGHDYYARNEWEGPVWRQRGTNIVLVQKGAPALRCALDMDFTMVRTGKAKFFHPLLWKHSGHLELSEIRKRYRVTDRRAIRRCFMDVPWEQFREWYIAATTGRWKSGEHPEEPWWHTALLVGSKELCETAAAPFPISWFRIEAHPPLTAVPDLQEHRCWSLSMARKRRHDYLQSLVPKAQETPPA